MDATLVVVNGAKDPFGGVPLIYLPFWQVPGVLGAVSVRERGPVSTAVVLAAGLRAQESGDLSLNRQRLVGRDPEHKWYGVVVAGSKSEVDAGLGHVSSFTQLAGGRMCLSVLCLASDVQACASDVRTATRACDNRSPSCVALRDLSRLAPRCELVAARSIEVIQAGQKVNDGRWQPVTVNAPAGQLLISAPLLHLPGRLRDCRPQQARGRGVTWSA